MADAGGASPPTPTGLVAPQPDISISGRFLGVFITFYIITLAIVVLQLRAAFYQKKRLNLEDFLPAVALIFATAQLGLLCAAIPYGFGRHNFYLSIDDQITGGLLVQISQVLWAWGIVPGGISNALLLRRVNTNWRARTDWKDTFWTPIIWTIIGIQPACAITLTLITLLQCQPIASSWDPRIPGNWPDLKTSQVALYVVGAIAIVAHLFLSFIPITFLRTMSLPFFTKFRLISLMGVGVLVIPVIGVKFVYVEKFTKTGDSLYDMVGLAICSVVKVLFGIIAACLPVLGPPSSEFFVTGRWNEGHAELSTLQDGSGVALGDPSNGGDNKTEIVSPSSERSSLDSIESVRVAYHEAHRVIKLDNN